MEYRTLGRTGLAVSTLGFGALEIGRNWPYWRQEKDDFMRPDESEAVKIIYQAIDRGVNFFDTAPAYLDSEAILGKAFKGMRKDVIIGTKCGEWFDGKNSRYDYSYSETLKFIENSLRLLQTDYIDLLQIHSANMDVIKKGETLSAMKEARTSGKVRFLGLSTDDVDTALESIRTDEYDTVQVSFNAINLQFKKTVFPEAMKNNIGVIVKDGMARGKLTSKYADITEPEEKKKIEYLKILADKYDMNLSDLAVRYVISHPAIASVIIGTKKSHHLQSNITSAKNGVLPDGLLDLIEEMNS